MLPAPCRLAWAQPQLSPAGPLMVLTRESIFLFSHTKSDGILRKVAHEAGGAYTARGGARTSYTGEESGLRYRVCKM